MEAGPQAAPSTSVGARPWSATCAEAMAGCCAAPSQTLRPAPSSDLGSSPSTSMCTPRKRGAHRQQLPSASAGVLGAAAMVKNEGGGRTGSRSLSLRVVFS
eukprot:scaffold7686_cov111-Isochrysis_galbana.AAC.3